MPNGGEYRPQKGAEGHLPKTSAGQKPEAVAEPQIAPAEPEAQLQPDPSGGNQKQCVAQLGKPPSERSEKAVDKPQSGTQHPADQKPPGGKLRGGHPKSRCRQPPLLGSS